MFPFGLKTVVLPPTKLHCPKQYHQPGTKYPSPEPVWDILSQFIIVSPRIKWDSTLYAPTFLPLKQTLIFLRLVGYSNRKLSNEELGGGSGL